MHTQTLCSPPQAGRYVWAWWEEEEDWFYITFSSDWFHVHTGRKALHYCRFKVMQSRIVSSNLSSNSNDRTTCKGQVDHSSSIFVELEEAVLQQVAGESDWWCCWLLKHIQTKVGNKQKGVQAYQHLSRSNLVWSQCCEPILKVMFLIYVLLNLATKG